jgi:hypothetical protein
LSRSISTAYIDDFTPSTRANNHNDKQSERMIETEFVARRFFNDVRGRNKLLSLAIDPTIVHSSSLQE